MNGFTVAAGVVTLAGVFAYINHRFFKLPTTIGLMMIALIISILIIILGKMGIHFDTIAEEVLKSIDFDQTLMNGMLSFLLFAGALHVNINDLAKQKYVIILLATVGVVTSTFIIGFAAYWVLSLLGFGFSFIYCLVLQPIS